MNEISVAEHPISVRSHGAHLLDLPRHYQRKSLSKVKPSNQSHLLFSTLRPLWSLSDMMRRSLEFHSVEITEGMSWNKEGAAGCKSWQRLLLVGSATYKWLCDKRSAIFVTSITKPWFHWNKIYTKLFNNS